MKKCVILLAAAMVAFSSCGVGGGSIKSDTDSLAYHIGIDLGHQLKGMDSTMNPNLVAKGIIDVFKGNDKIEHQEAVQWLQEYFNVKLPAKKLKESTDFLEGIEKSGNVSKTESGLIYEIIEPGDMEAAAKDDRDVVKVMYKGTLIGGRVFDETPVDETREFALNRVIPGWTEGMKLVGPGGKVKLYIPSELAYGQYGNQGIGPNEALVFDVEIVEVTPFVEPDAE